MQSEELLLDQNQISSLSVALGMHGKFGLILPHKTWKSGGYGGSSEPRIDASRYLQEPIFWPGTRPGGGQNRDEESSSGFYGRQTNRQQSGGKRESAGECLTTAHWLHLSRKG